MPTAGPSHRHSTPDGLPDYEEVMKMPDWETNRGENSSHYLGDIAESLVVLRGSCQRCYEQNAQSAVLSGYTSR